MKRKYFLTIGVLCLVLFISFAVPAWAAPATVTNGNIVNFADTVVPASATVENVIVIGGNATVDGTVRDEVVVINGNLTLASTAHVRDHVIVLGGELFTEDGAYVGKGIYRLDGNFALAATLMSAGMLVLILWAVKIFITAALVVVPGLEAWVWRAGVRDMSEIVGQRLVKTLIVGVLGGLAVIILIVLLAITVVGIPIAALAAITALLVTAAGFGGVCQAVGKVLPLKGHAEEQGVFKNTLAGAVVIALLFNVPLLGLVTLAFVVTAAFGGMLIKFFTRKEQIKEKE